MLFGGGRISMSDFLVPLKNQNFFLADQFQQRQKDADHFAAAFAADDQRSQRQFAFAIQPVFDVGGVKIDRRVVVEQPRECSGRGCRLLSSAG